MRMARNKVPLNTYVDPDLAARLDAWIKRQEAPWTKTAVVEKAVAAFLDEREGDPAESSK